MAQTASPLSTGATDQVAGTWRTRPETLGWFVGNLALCLLVPVLVMWFAPRYTMRREYGRAFACVAIAVAWFLFLVFVLGAASFARSDTDEGRVSPRGDVAQIALEEGSAQ